MSWPRTPTPPAGGAQSDAPQAGAQAPRLTILSQYIKDLSFENPRAPGSLEPGKSRPEIQVRVDARAQELGGRALRGHVPAALRRQVRRRSGVRGRADLCRAVLAGQRAAGQPAAGAADRVPAAAVPVRAADRRRRHARWRLSAADDRSDRLRHPVPAAPGAGAGGRAAADRRPTAARRPPEASHCRAVRSQSAWAAWSGARGAASMPSAGSTSSTEATTWYRPRALDAAKPYSTTRSTSATSGSQ